MWYLELLQPSWDHEASRWKTIIWSWWSRRTVRDWLETANQFWDWRYLQAPKRHIKSEREKDWGCTGGSYILYTILSYLESHIASLLLHCVGQSSHESIQVEGEGKWTVPLDGKWKVLEGSEKACGTENTAMAVFEKSNLLHCLIHISVIMFTILIQLVSFMLSFWLKCEYLEVLTVLFTLVSLTPS